jgi:phage I-like protein
MDELLALLGVETEDEAKKLVKALTRTLNTLSETTGTQDPSQIVGVVAAWKSSVEREKTLAAELSAIKAAAEKTEVDGLLDGLVADGRLEPAKRSDLEKLYADFGVGALRAAAGAMPKAAAISNKPPAEPSNSAPTLTVDGLTEDEIKLCRSLGKSTEEYLKDKQFIEAKSQGPVIELR